MKKLISATMMVVMLIVSIVSYADNTAQSSGSAQVTKNIKTILDSSYYRKPVIIDDKKLLSAYLQLVDPDRLYLTQEEVDAALKNPVDENSLKKLFDLSQKRQKESVLKYKSWSDAGIENIDFTAPDVFFARRDEASWSPLAEQERLWLQVFKHSILDLRAFDSSLDNNKIGVVLKKRLDRQLAHGGEANAGDTYNEALLQSLDPHSNYFPPEAAKEFSAGMSVSGLVGIGALLGQEQGKTIVVNVIPGGPAWKKGDLKPGDVITGVSDDKKKNSDIYYEPIRNVIEMIRGEKGTTVILQVKSGDQSKEISITRDQFDIKEESAGLETVKSGVYHIGVLKIPSFYRDMDCLRELGDHSKCKRVYRDVKNLLKEQAEKTDALVVDLRGNGGGSLDEVIDIAGLFVNKAPKSGFIVGTKMPGKVFWQKDSYGEDFYFDKPMVVLVDDFSASASEIFAGVMKAYHRAVIVGEPTFGKGSVQTLHDLETIPLSSIKFTNSLYYLPTGRSPQAVGVVPDIMLLDPDTADKKEKDLPNVILADQVKSQGHELYTLPSIKSLNKKHLDRTGKSPDFQYINDLRVLNEGLMNKKEISLVKKDFMDQKNQEKIERLAIENDYRHATGSPLLTSEELSKKENQVSVDKIIQTEAVAIAADAVDEAKPVAKGGKK